MGRTYFRRADPGYRGVRGEVIRGIQQRLTALGQDTRGLDGIYGQDTESALRVFQSNRGLQVSGQVDEETWTALMGPDAPRLFDRCLQITGDFEGHGFARAAGDFDGADRRRIQADRDAAFRRLGEQPEVKAIQLGHTAPYWQRAVADAGRFNLTAELGLPLCFDIAVQNGGIDAGRHEPEIRAQLEGVGTIPERGVREIIAEVVARRSNFPEAVRRRKVALATGEGEVNRVRDSTATWGLDDVPWDGA